MKGKLSVLIISLITIVGITTFSIASTNNYTTRKLEKEKIIEQRVEEGIITEEQAQEIKEKLENCNGEKQEKIGQEYNLRFGKQQSCSKDGIKNEQKEKQMGKRQKRNFQNNEQQLCKNICKE